MSDQGAPTLQQQAAAVELEAVNRRGFINVLRVHVGAKKRTAEELALFELRQPALEAAARTLRRAADRAASNVKDLGE